MDEQKEPLINHNPSLQRYYTSLESRIGYRLFLGGTRHFGYYQPDARWPFPITAALRRMEDHLFNSLKLQPGARVLDAGCGVGHVAMHLAGKGLQVYGIDVVKNHLRWAQQNITGRGLQKSVSVRLMDYHHLEEIPDESFDGVYTMETLVHATDAEKALGEFFRVLKPGGSIALYEYDHAKRDAMPQDVPNDLLQSLEQVNRGASMPANETFESGVLQSMLGRRGFGDVVVEDLSDNIKPMIMLFYVVAYIPFLVIQFLGLEAWFVNTQAGVKGYEALKWKLGRYVAATAKKPSKKVSGDGGLRERRTG